MTDALPLATLRDRAARGAAENPGLHLVALFGSAATGKTRPDSDADVAVLGGDFWKKSLELGSAFAWPEYQARAAVLYFDLKPIIERCTDGVRARLRAGTRS